jgi:uncharacterized protein YfaS (alpha-2-macroglobulin family)
MELLNRRSTFFLFAAIAVALCAAANAAGVRQFSPQGQADQANRASAVFGSDMVPLGRPDAPSPFVVDCGPLKGRARWDDSRRWSYTLERPLRPGERCDFALRDKLKAVDGQTVSGQASYAFFAPGPWPRSLTPQPGASIDEDQAFIVEPGGALRRESVENNLWCEADGVGNRIPVTLLPDATRNEILASLQREVAPATLAIACSLRLPAGARMRLVWGAGVTAENGARTSRNASFAYTVRQPFRASFSCQREKPGAPCSPLSDLRVDFSAPVDSRLVAGARLSGAGVVRSPDAAGLSGARENTVSAISFKGPLAQNAELTIELPEKISDEAGRALENAASFPLRLRTGALPPLAKFAGAFGILELKEGGVLPVTLRQVEAVLPLSTLSLSSQDPSSSAPTGGSANRLAALRLTDDGQVIAAMRELARFEQQTRSYRIGEGKGARDDEERFDPYYARELPFLKGRAGVASSELPRPGGVAGFEVVGIPLSKPGYHIVEIESRLLGAALLASPKPMYVRTSALVTNLAVHLKRGRDNALIWVTALDSGRPVAGAELRLSNCDGKSLWQGRSDSQGRALIDLALPETSCKDDSFFFASARLGDDYSFARSDWNEGIEPWRFGVETWGDSEARRIHTILDRTLLRAGQTVSMKHIARQRDSRSFAFPEAGTLPTELIIRHDGSGDEFRQPLAWDARGVATSAWKIPSAAKRGSYQIELSGARSGGTSTTGSFSVSDFRLPVFTGSVQGTAGRLVAPTEVPLALALSYLDGGAAKGAKVELSATLRPRWPQYKGYDGFRFNLDFDAAGRSAFAVDARGEGEQLLANRVPLTLDGGGSGKLVVPLPGGVREAGELYAEMSFSDPNGEIQTIHGSVELAPAAVALGIRVRDWASAGASDKDGGAVEIVVLDAQGKPVADAPVKVMAKRRVDYSHRKRIVGGFYAYENSTQFSDLGEVCKGRSDSRGKFVCAPGNSAGNVYLLAQASDRQGHVALAGTSYWVADGSDQWFAAGNQERIDVIPEKRSYAPGETARFQVRTPFREATALVSVEAGGIIETRVMTLSRFNPVIELPVKGDWGPNVFVSVLLVRGRVEPLAWYSFFSWGWREPAAWFRQWWTPLQPTAFVDLAKPAYKIGLASIDVGVDAFRLKVEVSAEKPDYQPRQTAQVRVKVTQPDGKPAPAGTEIAFAAVDQALLELRPNESWKLLDAMLPTRAYQVETATAQSQVVGKRHFGKKAVAPGGGGGRAPARELFDTLLLWAPRVVLDANGSATIAVPLNDSLSEFALVAVADAGAGLFGSGRASLRTRQDLQLISGLPPLVREKDRFSAQLTLRNATARAMQVSVSAKVSGGAANGSGERALETRQVKVEAQGAAELSWPGEAPQGEGALVWEFYAKADAEADASSGGASDRLRITQQVAPQVPLSVQQASFARIDGKLEFPIALPPGALSGKSGPLGGIELSLSARLSTAPPGLARFFNDYPFGCLEQKASVAIGLRDAARWQQVADELPTYLDANGLARYFPAAGSSIGNSGSVTLTAYLLDASHAAGFVIPPPVAQRMESGLAAFAEGRIRPEHWSPQNDLSVRKLAAIEALTRRGILPMSAIASLEIDPQRLPTSALIDWYLIAKRLTGLPQRAARLAAAERELRNRLSTLGGRLVFANERADDWWWLMVSSDANAFRLIEAVIDDAGWQGDLPALMQGAMLRQQRGHWQGTVANLWATIALDRFSQRFESESLSGNTHLALGPLPVQNFAWPAKAGEANKLLLPWPARMAAGERLQLTHEGSGKPWVMLQTIAAVPVSEARANGFRVTRELSAVQQKQPGKFSRGDLWRVRLVVEADQEMAWVVVSDPIPGGARIVDEGHGGARESRLADRSGASAAKNGESRTWPTYVERSFGAYRAYYSHVPRGSFSVEYQLRLNNSGEFSLPATRVEAMYAPEVFAESPNARLVVGE